MSTEPQITAWLATQHQAMVDLLRQTVDIDSGSYNKPGIDAVGAAIEAYLATQDIPTERVTQSKHGDCIRAMVGAEPVSTSPTNAPTNIVLMGHRDTVFPDGEVSRRPFTIKDGIAYGPGVADMKAGLVMNAFVLAAFRKFGGAPSPLVGLFTGDEEIGSPEGRPVIEAEARRHRPQGRRLLRLPHHRPRRPFRRQFLRGHQRHRGTGTQNPGDPRPDRPRPRHHPERRPGLRRPVGQHRRPLGRGSDRPALHPRPRP